MTAAGASKKPIMVVGPVGAGKSTLLKALKLTDSEVKKTEALSYTDLAIDTPGEMVTIPRFFNAIILNSSRARLILFLMDGERPSQIPARLALTMKAPAIGVVTKTDVARPENLARARHILKATGLKEIFEISSHSGEGLTELNARIAAFTEH